MKKAILFALAGFLSFGIRASLAEGVVVSPGTVTVDTFDSSSKSGTHYYKDSFGQWRQIIVRDGNPAGPMESGQKKSFWRWNGRLWVQEAA